MKTKIILIAAWVVSVLFLCVTIINENQFLNPELMQVVSAFLACLMSVLGVKVLPEPVKVFLKKLILFLFKKKKSEGDVAYFNDQASFVDKEKKWRK